MKEYDMEELDKFALELKQVGVRTMINELIKEGAEEHLTRESLIQSIVIALHIPNEPPIETVDRLRLAIAGLGRKFPAEELSHQTLADLARSVFDIGIVTFPEDLPF